MAPPTLRLLLARLALFIFLFCFNDYQVHSTIKALWFYIMKYKTLKTILKSHLGFKTPSCLPLFFSIPPAPQPNSSEGVCSSSGSRLFSSLLWLSEQPWEL